MGRSGSPHVVPPPATPWSSTWSDYVSVYAWLILHDVFTSSLRSVYRCREWMQMVRCALQVSSAHNKRSTGGRCNNGKHLVRRREKAASRQITTIALRS